VEVIFGGKLVFVAKTRNCLCKCLNLSIGLAEKLGFVTYFCRENEDLDRKMEFAVGKVVVNFSWEKLPGKVKKGKNLLVKIMFELSFREKLVFFGENS
jgi:hypothetical protein